MCGVVDGLSLSLFPDSALPSAHKASCCVAHGDVGASSSRTHARNICRVAAAAPGGGASHSWCTCLCCAPAWCRRSGRSTGKIGGTTWRHSFVWRVSRGRAGCWRSSLPSTPSRFWSASASQIPTSRSSLCCWVRVSLVCAFFSFLSRVPLGRRSSAVAAALRRCWGVALAAPSEPSRPGRMRSTEGAFLRVGPRGVHPEQGWWLREPGSWPYTSPLTWDGRQQRSTCVLHALYKRPSCELYAPYSRPRSCACPCCALVLGGRWSAASAGHIPPKHS